MTESKNTTASIPGNGSIVLQCSGKHPEDEHLYLGCRHTTISEDVDFCWDPIPPRPRHPDLYEGMSEVLRHWDVDPTLARQVQRGSRVGILPVKHLLEEAGLSLRSLWFP